MKRVAGAAAIISILLFFAGPASAAGPAKLLGMSNSREAAINRVSFVFDRLPEFEVDQSGQRVRVRLQETGLAQTFSAIPQSELFDPLLQVKIRKTKLSSLVDLYFRDIPEFVDVTINKEYSRFQVNVFWDKGRPAKRPGVLGKQLGRFKPIKDGAVAERTIASDYSGNWLQFFREFEWPVKIQLPMNYTLPDFPGPVVSEHTHFLPEAVKADAAAGLWPEAAQRLRELLKGDAGGGQAVFFRLLLLECRLRMGQPAGAARALMKLERPEKSETLEKPESQQSMPAIKPGDALGAWKSYLTAYALAASEKPHRAARLLAAQKEACTSVQSLAPWYYLLCAELELAVDQPDKALTDVGRAAEADSETAAESPELSRICRLRRADALYEQGRLEAAAGIYSKNDGGLQLIQENPRSIGNQACCLYRKKQYGRAYRHFFLLAEALDDDFPEKREMAKYWSAMARLHAREKNSARLGLWELEADDNPSEAAFRARLKLMDMARLSSSEPGRATVVAQYQDIIENGPTRQVREEAFFKQILSWHLAGRDLQSVKLLGRFFDDYWGGALLPEAQALLVDIFPEAVNTLVSKNAFFEALSLVAKYRDLLAQAQITYGFLHNLAESYSQGGFPEQAISAYQYILDFEKSAERKQSVYLPLIELYHQQEKDAQVLRYGSDYLSRYSGGEDRGEILYYYADVLFKQGERQDLPELLDEKNRPQSVKLDYLAGKVFFERGRYDLAEYYLSWAADADKAGKHPEIRLKLGDTFFADEKWENAMAVYESLLDTPRFAGHAGYRLIQICLELGRRDQALNIYEKMAEKDIGDQWRDLAAETVRIARTQ